MRWAIVNEPTEDADPAAVGSRRSIGFLNYDLTVADTMRHMLLLETVLQRLYDSEINVTVTMLWDGGFDFAFASYMEFAEIGTPRDDLRSFINPQPERFRPTPWHNRRTAAELADAIHKAALEKYPESDYARTYGRPN